MMVLRLSPVLLSAVLMAAHFSRHDLSVLVIASLLLPAILLIRRPWAARLMQLVLIFAALEWVRTAVSLARQRIATGEPWFRMVMILGVVALVTAVSALVFRMRAVRQRYGLSSE